MANDWDYAKHSKEVKLSGGIKNYNNQKIAEGYKKGNFDGIIEGIGIGAAVGGMIGAIAWPKIKKKIPEIKEYVVNKFSRKKEVMESKSNELSDCIEESMLDDTTDCECGQERNEDE